MKIKLLFLILFTVLLANFAYAESCEIYFFYSSTCPHCKAEYEFLDKIESKYPELNIQRYEVSQNYQLFEEISKKYNTIPVGVPRTYINGTIFLGFVPEDGPLEYSQGYEAYIGYQNQIEDAFLKHLESFHNITEDEVCIDEPVEPKSNNYLMFPIILLFLYGIFFLAFSKKIQKNYLIGGFFGITIYPIWRCYRIC
jgi:thiol-disulfide isomerase/thioredoxin